MAPRADLDGRRTRTLEPSPQVELRRLPAVAAIALQAPVSFGASSSTPQVAGSGVATLVGSAAPALAIGAIGRPPPVAPRRSRSPRCREGRPAMSAAGHGATAASCAARRAPGARRPAAVAASVGARRALAGPPVAREEALDPMKTRVSAPDDDRRPPRAQLPVELDERLDDADDQDPEQRPEDVARRRRSAASLRSRPRR